MNIISFPDDIPIRGFIGQLIEGNILPHTHQIRLWTHLLFNIEYNNNQVPSTFQKAEHSCRLLYTVELMFLADTENKKMANHLPYDSSIVYEFYFPVFQVIL